LLAKITQPLMFSPSNIGVLVKTNLRAINKTPNTTVDL